MLTTLLLAFFTGLMLGGALPFFAPQSDRIRNYLLKQAITSNKDGWIFRQVGGQLKPTPVKKFDEEAGEQGAYVYEVDGEEMFAEDPADRVMHIFNTPIALKPERGRCLTDLMTADQGHKTADQIDKESLDTTEKRIFENWKDMLVIGEERENGNRIVYCNPFYDYDEDDNSLVDPRGLTDLLRHGGSPDTPRKTAKNAKEAERAMDRLGGAKEKLGWLAAAFTGGILVYMGGSGGGGGGGVNIPVMLDFAMAVM